MLKSKMKHIILAAVLTLPSQYAFALFQVDVYDNLGNFNDIDVAVTAMSTATVSNSGLFDVVNFSQGGIFGNFAGDSLFPGTPGDYFGVHVTGNIFVPSGFNNWYGINHDDGALLQIAGLDIIKFPTPTAPRNSFGGIGNPGSGGFFAVVFVAVRKCWSRFPGILPCK